MLATSAFAGISIADASFESPVLGARQFEYDPPQVGWLFSPGAAVANPGTNYEGGGNFAGYPAPDGSQYLALQSGASATQTLSFPADGYYELSLYVAGRAYYQGGNFYDGDQTVYASIDGSDIFAENTVTNEPFQEFKASFFTTAGYHTLEVFGSNDVAYFDGTYDHTSYVDDVTIESTPEVSVGVGQTYAINASSGPGIPADTYAGITINVGGVLNVEPASNHANRQLLVVTAPGLSIAGTTGNWTGRLDLSNNDMDLPGASLATITDQIHQGYNNGSWNATGGIISSSAAGDSSHLTALGVIQNNQSGSPLFTTFDTYAVGASDILVKYTYYGDANLDGKVDGSDYSLIDNGSLQHLTGWLNGDFNYDGVIDGSDYTLIDNSFNTQGASLAAAVDPTANLTAEISQAAVPEPASLPMIALAAIAMLGRRRNQNRS